MSEMNASIAKWLEQVRGLAAYAYETGDDLNLDSATVFFLGPQHEKYKLASWFKARYPRENHSYALSHWLTQIIRMVECEFFEFKPTAAVLFLVEGSQAKMLNCGATEEMTIALAGQMVEKLRSVRCDSFSHP